MAVSAPAGSSPWSSDALGGQPPLTAILTWLVRVLVPDGSQLRLQQGMFAWGAGIIALLIALAVCATAAAFPKGPWIAAHVALSPVLMTVSLVSFDAFAVALVAAGLLAWHRGKYGIAGAALAAAFLTRPSLGTVLLACLILALHQGRRKAAGQVLLGAGVTTLVVVGATLAWGGDLFESFSVWRNQPASYGSLWYVLGFAGVNFSPSTLTFIAAVGWLCAVVLGLLLIRAEPAIGPEPVACLMLVVVLVTSRAVPIQAALWALPLLALCAITWRDHLIWAGVELAYFALMWTFLARDSNPAKALPEGWYGALTGVRILAFFFLARACLVASSDVEPAQSPRKSGLAED